MSPLVDVVFIKLTTAGVSITTLAQYLRQLPGGGEMFEAGASPRHQLAAYEDLRNRPVARHSLHHVHHHVALRPGLVHLVALELSPDVPQGVLDKWEDL